MVICDLEVGRVGGVRTERMEVCPLPYGIHGMYISIHNVSISSANGPHARTSELARPTTW